MSARSLHIIRASIAAILAVAVGSFFLTPLSVQAVTCPVTGTAIGSYCVVFLTSGTSWSVPSDWNSSNNIVEVIGGGGSGGAATGLSRRLAGGGGGGGYSKSTNVSLTPGGSVTYAVGAGGTAVAGSADGNAGGDTIFNGTGSTCDALQTSEVCAKGGSGGGHAISGTTVAAASGGAAAGGVGSIKNSGGAGGAVSQSGFRGASGGGGAGGSSGDGNNGVDSSSLPTIGSNGGSGDAGSGGSGGTGNIDGNGGAGGNGTEWNATHGSGGGGGGAHTPNNVDIAGGAAGSYGAGGGGAVTPASVNPTSGAGAAGIIVISYIPASPAFIHSTITISDSVSVKGSASVIGALSKGSGTFVIDHPLDPKNKLLYHSFVESPDVLNIYDGIATLDERGEATVALPGYFFALNKDFKYLVTPIGEPMPDLYISSGATRSFLGLFGTPVVRISGGAAGGRVSWQVSGVRHDPFIRDNPIVPEVEKGPDELADQNEYLFPEFYVK